jgi:hypothetical protein
VALAQPRRTVAARHAVLSLGLPCASSEWSIWSARTIQGCRVSSGGRGCKWRAHGWTLRVAARRKTCTIFVCGGPLDEGGNLPPVADRGGCFVQLPVAALWSGHSPPPAMALWGETVRHCQGPPDTTSTYVSRLGQLSNRVTRAQSHAGLYIVDTWNAWTRRRHDVAVVSSFVVASSLHRCIRGSLSLGPWLYTELPTECPPRVYASRRAEAVGRVCYTRGYFQGRSSPHSPLVRLFTKDTPFPFTGVADLVKYPIRYVDPHFLTSVITTSACRILSPSGCHHRRMECTEAGSAGFRCVLHPWTAKYSHWMSGSRMPGREHTDVRTAPHGMLSLP